MKSKSLERVLLSEKRKEVRKEKSKEAARCRREQESLVYDQLLASLPVSNKVKPVLDKTQVIRLSINYIKTRQIAQGVLYPPGLDTDDEVTREAREVVNSMDGLVMLISPSSEVLYVTENVNRVIGFTQTDMIGCKLSEFTHPADMLEIESMLRSSDHHKQFTGRFKSAVLSKGRVVNIKSAAYKPIQFAGHRLQTIASPEANHYQECWLLAVYPISDEETPLVHGTTFTSVHDLDMTFKPHTTHPDSHGLYEETRFSANQLDGSTLFALIHPRDIQSVRASFVDLYTKMKTVTPCYSLLAGGGGHLRVITHASLVNHPRLHKPDQVICVHHIVSGIEQTDLVLSDIQLAPGLCSLKTEDEVIKMEAVSPLQAPDSTMDCDVFSMTASVFQDLLTSPSKREVSDNIFTTTASMFDSPAVNAQVDGAYEPEVCDVEALTASMFSDAADALGPLVGNLSSEGLLDDDNLYIDTSKLELSYDNEELMMRAPYISMDDVFPFNTDACKSPSQHSISNPSSPTANRTAAGDRRLPPLLSPSDGSLMDTDCWSPYTNDLAWLSMNDTCDQRGVKRSSSEDVSEGRNARCPRLDPEFLAAELEEILENSKAEPQTPIPDFTFRSKLFDAPIREGHSYLDRPRNLIQPDLHRLVTCSWNTRPPIEASNTAKTTAITTAINTGTLNRGFVTSTSDRAFSPPAADGAVGGVAFSSALSSIGTCDEPYSVRSGSLSPSGSDASPIAMRVSSPASKLDLTDNEILRPDPVRAAEILCSLSTVIPPIFTSRPDFSFCDITSRPFIKPAGLLDKADLSGAQQFPRPDHGAKGHASTTNHTGYGRHMSAEKGWGSSSSLLMNLLLSDKCN